MKELYKTELEKQEELKNRQLMKAMWTIFIISAIFYIIILSIVINILEEGALLYTIIFVATVVFIIACLLALQTELDAGYYECKNCHHKFIPTYKEALFSLHLSVKKYLQCPECHKRSWAKKVMSK